MEINTCYALVAHSGMCGNESLWCIDSDRCFWFVSRQRARCQRDSRDSENAVTTHRAVAFVVNEQNTQVGIWRDRRCQDTAVHISVAARLPHQRGTEVIEFLDRVSPAREHCVAGNFGKAARNNAKRLTFRVRINRGYSAPIAWRVPARRVHGVIHDLLFTTCRETIAEVPINRIEMKRRFILRSPSYDNQPGSAVNDPIVFKALSRPQFQRWSDLSLDNRSSTMPSVSSLLGNANLMKPRPRDEFDAKKLDPGTVATPI